MAKKAAYSILLASAALGGGISTPAPAQETQDLRLEEVIVTARRREELVQDVPISMTIFNQEQLDDRNILSASDLAVYTPSMVSNTRFGTDFASFTIRGFHQELRTTASVGVYFAEVVAPRGANSTTSGDGAGPGDFFDLQNVQVLKGPQGTLFGRNTTGGAVLLVPQRPTDELEGYVEVSAGNYDMLRGQGVLNVPFSDNVRARFGLDYQKRDGYIENLTTIGPDDFADVDYIAGRASLVVDITDSLENYTIIKGVDSENNGSPGQTFACDETPGGLGVFFFGSCFNMLDSHPESRDFHRTFNTIPNPTNELKQWQVINTLTWDVSDDLTVKNILSYGHLETKNRTETFGTDFRFPIPFPTAALGTQSIIFAQTGSSPDYPTTSQESFVGEIQLQGSGLEEKLIWQAGIYYEESKPDGLAGARSPGYVSCDPDTIYGDPENFRCNDLLGAFLPFPEWGLIGAQPYGITYENRAVYGQVTYDFNDQFSVTAGLRYTEDKTDGTIESTYYRFPSDPFNGGLFPVAYTQFEKVDADTKSEEPTWLISLDYHPTEDVLLYAKYARGYRQGGLNIAAPEGLQVYGPEQVDTYEIGAKTSFGGSFPGIFNIAAFYNDFTDQAIQVGLLPVGAAGTTTISNIGESTIWGVEIDASVQLTEGLLVNAAYSYLDTEVKDFIDPLEDPRYDDFIANGGIVSNANAVEGEPLPFAPENSLTLTADYRLPFDESIGEIHTILSYIYSDEVQTTSPTYSPYGVLPSYELVNFNVNWVGIAGSPFDVALFATNLLDEEYTTFVAGVWESQAFETRYSGLPRMYGARLRYSF